LRVDIVINCNYEPEEGGKSDRQNDRQNYLAKISIT